MGTLLVITHYPEFRMRHKYTGDDSDCVVGFPPRGLRREIQVDETGTMGWTVPTDRYDYCGGSGDEYSTSDLAYRAAL